MLRSVELALRLLCYDGVALVPIERAHAFPQRRRLLFELLGRVLLTRLCPVQFFSGCCAQVLPRACCVAGAFCLAPDAPCTRFLASCGACLALHVCCFGWAFMVAAVCSRLLLTSRLFTLNLKK